VTVTGQLWVTGQRQLISILEKRLKWVKAQYPNSTDIHREIKVILKLTMLVYNNFIYIIFACIPRDRKKERFKDARNKKSLK
jgi:hypothetical protein